MKKNIDLSLHLLTEQIHLFDLLEKKIILAINSGITVLQMRSKNMDYLDSMRNAIKLQEIIKKYNENVCFIINDNVKLAKEIDADGVHIGQSDLPALKAREILGDNKIIGLSIENIEQAIIANNLPIDYMSVSPLFATISKHDAAEPLGIEKLTNIVKIAKIPIITIGGINLQNLEAVMRSGVDGIAVISAILYAQDISMTTQDMVRIINSFKIVV